MSKSFYFDIWALIESLTFIGDMIFFKNPDLFGFWTLQIEWVFYVVCAAMVYFGAMTPLRCFLISIVLFKFYNLYYILYMFIGTLTYLYFYNKIGFKNILCLY